MLACLAGCLVAGCGKTTVEMDPQELTLRPRAAVTTPGDLSGGNNPGTKADPELTGVTLGTDNSYVIYASASNEAFPTFMQGQLYSYISANSQWEASSSAGTADPVYWPVGGGALDFLAYACTPAAQTALGSSIAWAAVPANGFTVSDWDTYANQYDLMYAFANAQTVAANSGTVDMEFNHSMAVIAFTAKCSVANVFTLNSITINGLEYSGTFTANNAYTEFSAGWSSMTAADKVVYNLSGTTADYDYIVPTTATQCAQHLLVPQQAAKSVTIRYTMPGAASALDYTVRLPRTVWKAGHKYVYALDITLNEIIITETVTDWSEASIPQITLN